MISNEVEYLTISKKDLANTPLEGYWEMMRYFSKEQSQGLDHILLNICHHFSLDVEDVKSKKRDRELVYARSLFSFLAYNIYNIDRRYSFQAVGDFINRHHASIIHLINRLELDLETYELERIKLKGFIMKFYGEIGWVRVKNYFVSNKINVLL